VRARETREKGITTAGPKLLPGTPETPETPETPGTPEMMEETGQAGEGARSGEREEDRVEWTVHLARDEPARAALVLLTALFAAALCFHLFGSLLFALFTAAALVAATAEFLFPIRYRLTAEAAEMRNLHNWRRIDWREVKKAYLLEDGVKLSPLAARTRLEPFRGVFLRFGPEAESKERILEAVRSYRDAAGRGAD
jgi:hypothetical protein